VLEWHTYAMEWSADGIDFFMDNELVASYNLQGCPVYEEPMFVLLNVAMGGNLGGAIDPELDLATLEIDYVAHCQQSEDSESTTCDETTTGAFQFEPALDADGQWVIDDPAFAGNAQGLTFDYMAFADLMFVSWFTYVDPSVSSPAEGLDVVGAQDNRWLTAQLTVDGNIATGPLFASTGGRFDSPPQPGQDTTEVGSLSIEFTACDLATVSYEIDGTSLVREFPIIPLEKRVNGGFQCASEAAAAL